MKRSTLLGRSLNVIAYLWLSAGTGFAADWYVDAVGGGDANSGTSATDAWKTVTHALTVVPGGGDVVHLAAGVYDEALGEVFPWSPPRGTNPDGRRS